MTIARTPPPRRNRAGLKTPVRKVRKVSSLAADMAEGSEDVVEIFPFGLVFGLSMGRPVLLMKDADKKEALPVWLNPIEAGMALSDRAAAPGTPHSATRKILEALGLKVESCHFAELLGHHQYVELSLSGDTKLEKLRCRADEAISLCLALGTRFFSTPSFMRRCRDVDAELLGLGKGMQLEGEFGSKNHPYVI